MSANMPRGSRQAEMKRPIHSALGLISVGLGAIGAFLPIMPTVPFLLLAVYFFARSNPDWEQRILDHPTWGPQVLDWRERRAISRRAKTMAIGAMATGAVFTWWGTSVRAANATRRLPTTRCSSRAGRCANCASSSAWMRSWSPWTEGHRPAGTDL